jgi:hypothetical protein
MPPHALRCPLSKAKQSQVDAVLPITVSEDSVADPDLAKAETKALSGKRTQASQPEE